MTKRFKVLRTNFWVATEAWSIHFQALWLYANECHFVNRKSLITVAWHRCTETVDKVVFDCHWILEESIPTTDRDDLLQITQMKQVFGLSTKCKKVLQIFRNMNTACHFIRHSSWFTCANGYGSCDNTLCCMYLSSKVKFVWEIFCFSFSIHFYPFKLGCKNGNCSIVRKCHLLASVFHEPKYCIDQEFLLLTTRTLQKLLLPFLYVRTYNEYRQTMFWTVLNKTAF